MSDHTALLRECLTTLRMWADVAPAVSLCADIEAALAATTQASPEAEALLEAMEDVLQGWWGGRIVPLDDASSGYVNAAMERAEQAASNSRRRETAEPADMPSMSRRKAEWLAERGHKFTGYVMHKEGDRAAIIDGGAVRWLSDADLWLLMHDEGSRVSATPPKEAMP